MRTNPTIFGVLLLALNVPLLAQKDWPAYGHDAGGTRFSPLTQINPQNVAKLRRVWTYSLTEGPNAMPDAAGKAGRGGGGARRSELTPLVINGVMYITTPTNRVAALEADTGKEIWNYEIKQYGTPATRGLSYWPGEKDSPPTLFVGTGSGYIVAINAKTGTLIPAFATEGALNMRTGMTENFPNAPYGLSSAPAIYKNLIISGSRVQESPQLGPYGDVRAWDARTGKLAWTFHTVPRPGEPGNETWEGESWKDRSGTNVWGTLTVDTERGIVYLPLGCPTRDYYGADRKGANLYSSTLVALDAVTGKLKWHFQTVHHDIWDYDLQAPPLLMDITVRGVKIPAVAQMTKQALLFVFDRVTGKPIYGVEERPTPQKNFVDTEHPWPTQPFPVKPPPLARNTFTEAEIAKVTPEHEKFCRDMLAKDGGLHIGGPYLDFGFKPAILFPGTLGGGNWHGVSFDPNLGYIFANTQSFGEVFQIVDGARGLDASRYKFWDPQKLWPCSAPPWGELSAIDTKTGDIAWRVPLGVFDELEAKGIPKTGVPNMGGTIATAGGLVFVAGTVDDRFRAFESKTGKEVWVENVGSAAHAVPITYEGKNGKQYVSVTVSGGGFLGDHTIPPVLMTFALP